MKTPVNQLIEQGERLKQIRNDLKLGQTEFAEMLSLDQAHYSRTENGKHEIKAKTLVKIADIGYNIHWLITGEGEMKRGN